MKHTILALAMALAIGFSFTAATELQRRDIASKVIRLHVVANSDSQEDQQLKLKVRDGVLAEMQNLFDGCTDVREAAEILQENLDIVLTAAVNTARENGCNSEISAVLTNEMFPTKDYETFSLPAGNYDALKIMIGNGEGHNWWCVVFPAMCLDPTSGTEAIAQCGLSDGEISFISGDDDRYVLKFKTLEILSKIKGWIKGDV